MQFTIFRGAYMFDLNRFKDLCKKQGIKQSALFEMVDRPRTYSSDLKKVKNVPAEYVEAWAAALHTTPAYLMGETDDPSPETKKEPTGIADGLTEEDRELIEAFRAASPEKRQAILALLK